MLQQWLMGISSFHHHNIEIEILFKVRSLLKGSVWFYSNERVEQSNRFIRRLAAELGEPDETPIKWSQCKAPLVTSSAVQTRVNPLPLSPPPPLPLPSDGLITEMVSMRLALIKAHLDVFSVKKATGRVVESAVCGRSKPSSSTWLQQLDPQLYKLCGGQVQLN